MKTHFTRFNLIEYQINNNNTLQLIGCFGYLNTLSRGKRWFYRVWVLYFDFSTSSKSIRIEMFVFVRKHFFSLSIFIRSVSLYAGNDDRSIESMCLCQNNRKMKINEATIINMIKITVFHREDIILEHLFMVSLIAINNTGFMKVFNVSIGSVVNTVFDRQFKT